MANIKFTGEEALGRVAEYVNKKLTFASSMPESPDTDTIVLYIGASNNSSPYVKGGIYQYDGTKWNLINLYQQVELTQEEYDDLPEEAKNNGTTYFITDANIPGSIVSGYYNEEDGLFYNEYTYDTEMAANVNVLYIDVPTNIMYIYDIMNENYVQVGGSGGTNVVVKYVDALPPSDIENIIYACRTTDDYQYTAAEGFLDNNDFFTKNDITYTPNPNIQVKVTLNEEVSYKELFFIEYQNDSFKVFYKNGTEETLQLNEILYCQITYLTFYAGDAENQKFIYISSTNLENILRNYYTKEEVNTLLNNYQHTTFNGRSGSILPVAGDYNDNQITLSSVLHIGGEAQTTVAEALNALKNNSGSGIETPVSIENGGTGNTEGNALGVKLKSDNTKAIKFGIDSNGNYGYYKDGADTVTPFKTGSGNLQTKTATVTPSASWSGQNTNNATITPDTGYDGMSQVNVNVPMLRDHTLLTVKAVETPSTVYSGDTSQSNSTKMLRLAPTKDGMSYTGSYLNLGPSSYMGDATAADVASGKTFSSASGIQITGTGSAGASDLPEDNSFDPDGLYDTGSGYKLKIKPYYQGIVYPTKDYYIGKSEDMGDAGYSDVLSGKTFSSKNGIHIEGTIATRNASSETITSAKTYSAGYYPSSWTVTPGSNSNYVTGVNFGSKMNSSSIQPLTCLLPSGKTINNITQILVFINMVAEYSPNTNPYATYVYNSVTNKSVYYRYSSSGAVTITSMPDMVSTNGGGSGVVFNSNRIGLYYCLNYNNSGRVLIGCKYNHSYSEDGKGSLGVYFNGTIIVKFS